MVYAYLIGIPAALLVLFLTLVTFEARTGRRVLAGRRDALDLKVSRLSFIAQHVDWGAFVNDMVRSSFERALHDFAHGSLIVVRALERQLTGIVRTLRARRDGPAIAPPNEGPTRMQSAMTFVKKSVRRSRKVLPPIEKE